MRHTLRLTGWKPVPQDSAARGRGPLHFGGEPALVAGISCKFLVFKWTRSAQRSLVRVMAIMAAGGFGCGC